MAMTILNGIPYADSVTNISSESEVEVPRLVLKWCGGAEGFDWYNSQHRNSSETLCQMVHTLVANTPSTRVNIFAVRKFVQSIIGLHPTIGWPF